MEPQQPNPQTQYKPTEPQEQPQQSQPPVDPTQPPAAPVEEPKPKRNKLKIVLIVLLILIIAGGAFAAYQLLANNQQSEQAAQQETKKDIPLLRIGTTTGPLNSLYPHNQNTEISLLINYQIFEGLVRYEDQTKIVPALATEWSNPDSSTWVFNLKEDVKFHTGRTMTAEDVKYSIETVQKENEGLELFHETIKSVKAIDENTVEISTDGPDPVLLNKLTFLPIIDSQSEETDSPINGTGPYTLKPDTEITEDEINLVAFDDYHGGHVYTRELAFIWKKSEAEALADFNDGKIDIANDLGKDIVRQANDHQLYVSRQPGLHFLGMNTTKEGPLQQVEVRQALRHIVDVPALLEEESIYADPVGQLIPKEIPGYNPAIQEPEKDVDKAKELLATAGYPNGLTLNMISSAAPPKLIKELQRQYAEGGVKINHENIEDFGLFLDTAFSGGPELDLYYSGYSSDVLDGTDFLIYLIQDLDNYDLPKLDQYIKEVNATTDQADRLAKLQEAAKFVEEQALIVPLFDTQSVSIMKQPYIIDQDTNVGLGAYFYKVYLQ